MEIPIHRQTFGGKSHLDCMKTQRSGLSKLDGEEQLQTPLPSPHAPRSIHRLHNSAMLELFQEQQRQSSIQMLRRSNTRRPTSSSSSASSYSSESSMASRRRLLEESEKQLARALAQAKEATVHGAQLDDLNTRASGLFCRVVLA
ncbi:unnamed protein product [Peronospora destructor]|uniref:Uncharacterized protein n=1 Tax=Peronospora destructor TaxID=86335 RepID=A0AAV0UMM0_9STRA|nr:unnamed protein product [Peronospora destructor]